MNPPDTITVEALDGEGAAQAEEDFSTVYAEVFAEPPYHETDDDVADAFRRFRAQARKPTFRGALAHTAEGEPVGMAFGYPLGAGTEWWGRLVGPVSEEMRSEDGHRTFGLMEMAVRIPWRRHGVARRLHEALLTGGQEERSLLNVHPSSEAAQAAYRSWGYRRIGEARPWHGADLHDVLLLDRPPA
ncbi:GNAT family N-acetyltransferase [Streptomyces iconiensis]|uniref:GNAT family N-acetyltransferase n=1 Tax=Streptomyces iconiensis TaxID=1384038 RepID=A0ABT6ZXU7_9ACTN|nr:GNAT family N-acetyltransferase [Streptomyces iconiensis]MDJ1133629.1 GNAT family N-acetyltransferase [Streptomyces iconiensis]